MTHRRSGLSRGLLIGAPAALVVAGLVGYGVARRPHRASSMQAMDSSFESDIVGDMGATGQQQFGALMQQGASNLKKRNFDAARGAFRKALELQPHNPAAQLGLARTLYEQGDFAAAETLTAEVVHADGSNARALYLLGSILRASGQSMRAKKAFQQCVALDASGQFGKSAQQVLNTW